MLKISLITGIRKVIRVSKGSFQINYPIKNPRTDTWTKGSAPRTEVMHNNYMHIGSFRIFLQRPDEVRLSIILISSVFRRIM